MKDGLCEIQMDELHECFPEHQLLTYLLQKLCCSSFPDLPSGRLLTEGVVLT